MKPASCRSSSAIVARFPLSRRRRRPAACTRRVRRVVPPVPPGSGSTSRRARVPRPIPQASAHRGAVAILLGHDTATSPGSTLGKPSARLGQAVIQHRRESTPSRRIVVNMPRTLAPPAATSEARRIDAVALHEDIQGELPGRFVWRDDRAVAFLTIAPLQPGHTLVVPDRGSRSLARHGSRADRPPDRGLAEDRQGRTAGLLAGEGGHDDAGLEVPHVHLHLVPIHTLRDLDFSTADANPDPAAMDAAADELRAVLREHGHAEVVDA